MWVFSVRSLVTGFLGWTAFLLLLDCIFIPSRALTLFMLYEDGLTWTNFRLRPVGTAPRRQMKTGLNPASSFFAQQQLVGPDPCHLVQLCLTSSCFQTLGKQHSISCLFLSLTTILTVAINSSLTCIFGPRN